MSDDKTKFIPRGMRYSVKPPKSERGTQSGKPPGVEVHCRECCKTVPGNTCVDKKKWRCGAQFSAPLGAKASKCPNGHRVRHDGWQA